MTINPIREKTNLYPPEWAAFARAVKDQAGWACSRCGHPHEPATGHTLTVHHIDHNKKNNDPSNLAALCQKCHIREEAYYRTSYPHLASISMQLSYGQQLLPGFEPISIPHLRPTT